MPHITLKSFAALAAIGLALSACAAPAAPRASGGSTAEAVAAPHWSYDEDGGAGGWSKLASDFDTCGSGVQQSPIDLPTAVPRADTAVSLTIQTEPATAEEADTGHASQVSVDDDASVVRYDGHEFELLQIHAHTPAEHTIDGVAPDAEFHLVHSTDDGHLLVLSVLATIGEGNEHWQSFFDTATGDDGTTAPVDVATMLPSSLEHWSYEGSLTTPPCTEGVQWVVFSTPVEVSAQQVEALTSLHDHNSRPTQPIGDRAVSGGSATLSTSDD